ncbi:hypothetical protein CMV_014563 [Castanea mollissima]|uniref:X8 domain-containing protein n=1 Tax=Castanea mollissima TaxID=60419 RepID=A0A8J4QXF9_9ROSI|nr:hypothetical protein CMV_014563 [Castanea mollissima]
MAAQPQNQVLLLLLVITTIISMVVVVVEGASWCVARSDASNQALQTALDYACGSGADCTPLQSNGLCFLPNTIQAHASYAFNSYFQRKAMAPGSCDFSAAATIAQTDPSYGSCVYPSSVSTAGGTITPTTQTSNNPTTPTTTTTTTPANGGSGGLTPGLTPPFPDNSKASLEYMISSILVPLSILLVLTLIFQPM